MITNGLNSLHLLPTTYAPDVSTTTKTPAATAGSSEVASDKARLSLASSLVTKAISGSDVRTDKVSAIQNAIANGTYQVSAGDLANKIIASLVG